MTTARALRFAQGRRSLALACAVAACARHAAPTREPHPARAGHWLGTWTASQQLVEPRNMPPVPGLTGSTLRQVIHLSVGGPALRVRLSNAFSGAPLSIGSAHLARSLGGHAIDVTSDRRLMFGGRDSVLIAPGATATSDSLPFDAASSSDLAVTIYVAAAPPDLTGHPGSRTTSYIQTGGKQWVVASAMPDAVTTDHWYVLAGVDAAAQGAAVVTLGNSITDGRGSGTNRNDRWPDNLARRLQADPRTRDVAVLNAGIGGNAVVTGGLGPTALARLDRDVLEPAGARWVILLEGVNDIGAAHDSASAAAVAARLIDAYREIIDRVHARGLRIYGGTLTPFGGSQYDRPGCDAARQTVNTWIRTSAAFDRVLDFDAAVRDPAQPTRLLPALDTGDHLHPNEAGYRVMADAIDLALFVQ